MAVSVLAVLAVPAPATFRVARGIVCRSSAVVVVVVAAAAASVASVRIGSGMVLGSPPVRALRRHRMCNVCVLMYIIIRPYLLHPQAV